MPLFNEAGTGRYAPETYSLEVYKKGSGGRASMEFWAVFDRATLVAGYQTKARSLLKSCLQPVGPWRPQLRQDISLQQGRAHHHS